MGFQQGLSGLNAASKNLDVIGHNIANSNTTGFKASRAEFAEMVASAIGAAGGSNAGIGVEVAAVAQQFSQGNITITGNTLDVAINGSGFFMLQQPDGSSAYTRAGNFKLDKDGDLKTNSGATVLGFPIDPATGKPTAGSPRPLVFPTGAPIPAKQTEKAKITFNLDARAVEAATATPPTPRATYGTSITAYDSQGVPQPVSFYFVKTGNPNEWEMYTTLDETLQPPGSPVGTITFDGNGKIISGGSFGMNISTAPANPNSPIPGPDFVVNFDFSDSTQYGTKWAVSESTQDGYTAGQLTGINIGTDGTILTRYSNGVTRPEGVVSLATFRNTQGLSDIGNNLWVETYESGQPTVGQPTNGAFGQLRSGALEDSNVDLTAELVNMMTAQRTYQANAQTIKTQDQVMSTLVNLR
ncbi:MAG: flagellar hook protein FlgE [Comamonadaceae bacterium]|nr:flagellar hook protein FlgE [Comamonadaceae bacterium]